ncbi:putative 5exonuclease subunit ski4 [Diaporthe ampelina]|uniref:Putative 5exonuclease subunit ski4 n=1 Tax=Diaporthe ampelina TaxID=1214573 RepID=A0A0G2G0A3_9PEZI|nr:putative 5exonuclease subunit ski4 [Diaporthe ampelina]
MTLTMPALPQPRLSTIPCCPSCGNDLSLSFIPKDLHADAQSPALTAAQKQIEDLEAQVRLLNQKATAAVDRWADYEDELGKLKAELSRRNNSASAARPQTPTLRETPSSPATNSTVGSPSAAVTSFASAASSRISAYLSRKSTPNLKAQQPGGHQSSLSTSSLLPQPAGPAAGTPGHQSSRSTSSLAPPRTPGGSGGNGPPPPLTPLTLSLSGGKVTWTPGHSPAPSSDDLLEALTREQQLRLAAEGKLNDSSKEIEDLSVTLFEQANEMVASERRARARLEERVGELERREGEKKRRLERLEQAMGRIERARALLNGGSDSGAEKRASA